MPLDLKTFLEEATGPISEVDGGCPSCVGGLVWEMNEILERYESDVRISYVEPRGEVTIVAAADFKDDDDA